MSAKRVIDRDIDFYFKCFEVERVVLAMTREERRNAATRRDAAGDCVKALMRYRNMIDLHGPANHPTKDKP